MGYASNGLMSFASGDIDNEWEHFERERKLDKDWAYATLGVYKMSLTDLQNKNTNYNRNSIKYHEIKKYPYNVRTTTRSWNL